MSFKTKLAGVSLAALSLSGVLAVSTASPASAYSSCSVERNIYDNANTLMFQGKLICLQTHPRLAIEVTGYRRNLDGTWSWIAHDHADRYNVSSLTLGKSNRDCTYTGTRDYLYRVKVTVRTGNGLSTWYRDQSINEYCRRQLDAW